MRYSIGFKNSILRRVLPPENQSIASVAQDTGVAAQTINNWLSKYNSGNMQLPTEGYEPNPTQRGVLEKFKLLIEGRSLDEEELGDWLRRHGMHTEHLTLWEQELEGFVTDKQHELQQKNKELEKENKLLKKEAQRNQKAMAEALALLTLKKKVDKIFDSNEED